MAAKRKVLPVDVPVKRGMSDEHKAALAEGREQGRAVRGYLEALDAHKPKRGRKRTPESIAKRIATIESTIDDAAPVDRLLMLQEQADLEAEMEQLSVAADLSELEAGFVQAAAGYSERKGISYDTWRRAGVPAAVLRAAGVKR